MSLNVVMPIYSAQSGIVQAQKTFANAAQSIASGLSSSVNPADIYVASGLNSDIRANNVAANNIQTGMNFTGIADSALGNVNDSLQRIRELTIQASNGVYSESQISAMQEEINQNAQQIQQILNNSQFNGLKTLNLINSENPAPVSGVNFMVNPETSQSVVYDPNLVLGDMNFDVSSPEAARQSLALADSMISEVSAKRGDIGAVQNNLLAAGEQLSSSFMSGMQALGDIQDTDYISAILELKQSKFSMEAMAKVMKAVMNSERYVLDLLK